MNASPLPGPDDTGELHRFFELSIDMLCIASKDGYFRRINAAWEKTLGHPMSALVAHPYVSFVHPEDREATLREAHKLTTGEDTVWFENRYRCADGSYRWLLWRATAPAGCDLIYAAARDITDHKAASEALARTAQELKRSNAELEQFASVASHDLQEPLRMVTSYLDLLKRRAHGQLDAEAEKFIGFAVDGAQRMRALIEDLLAWSRVGTRVRPFEPTNVDAVLGSVRTNLQVAVTESGAEISSDPLPTVRGDPVQVGQLLQNLIANGIKFHGSRAPRVHVGVRPRGAKWEFAVRDNGIGIDSKHFERIFTIFQRLHTRADYAGTGIGLAVCKKIVERHGGEIWVESQPGEGTTVFFTLPRA